MKYEIIAMRTARTIAGPGAIGYDAEATITSDQQELYVHVNFFDGFTSYTVSEVSTFDYLTGDSEEVPEFEALEEYESLDAAFDSQYLELFVMLDKMLYQMIHGPESKKEGFSLGNHREDSEYIDGNRFHFGVFQSFYFDNAQYEACASLTSLDGLTFFTTLGDELVETFEDIELAAYSKWFGIYYSLKRELRSLIEQYQQAHPDVADEMQALLEEVK